MIKSNVKGSKTLEQFYSRIIEQQKKAHGEDYCSHHDAIVRVIEEGECSSYKELGTHQGATAAAALLSGKIRKIELVDISFDLFNESEHLFLNHCYNHDIRISKKEEDSSSIISATPKTFFDILLIDSLHHPEHMRKELEIHSQYVNKYIVAHDTSLPTDRLFKEILEFLSKNKKIWKLKEHYAQNVGYTIIERKRPKTR